VEFDSAVPRVSLQRTADTELMTQLSALTQRLLFFYNSQLDAQRLVRSFIFTTLRFFSLFVSLSYQQCLQLVEARGLSTAALV